MEIGEELISRDLYEGGARETGKEKKTRVWMID